MPGEPVRERDFHREAGEPGEALATFVAWARRQQRLANEEALKADLTGVRWTPSLVSAISTKAAAVVNYWLDRNNLRAATFWLSLHASMMPKSYEERVREMDRAEVQAELDAWALRAGVTAEEALIIATKLPFEAAYEGQATAAEGEG